MQHINFEYKKGSKQKIINILFCLLRLKMDEKNMLYRNFSRLKVRQKNYEK